MQGYRFVLNIRGTTSEGAAPPRMAKGCAGVSAKKGRPVMGVRGITPQKFGKYMFKIVHFRAEECYIILIKQIIDFVLNAINFVVEFFDQP